jgi:hypothetical protein
VVFFCRFVCLRPVSCRPNDCPFGFREGLFNQGNPTKLEVKPGAGDRSVVLAHYKTLVVLNMHTVKPDKSLIGDRGKIKSFFLCAVVLWTWV